MKQVLLLFLAWFAVLGTAQAQTFSDDFESYSDGDKIAASSDTWTTWSNSNAEDAPISTAQAHSGTKSLLIKGTNSDPTKGGPSDIVLPFATDVLAGGSFDLEMFLYFPEGKGGYMNIQGSKTIGKVFTDNWFFNGDGTLTGSAFDFIGQFDHDKWFKFNVKVDVTSNIWAIFIDDVFQGSYACGNKIITMDIYPLTNASEMYIDDVAFTVASDVIVLPTLNATLNRLDVSSNGLVGKDLVAKAVVRNTGMEAITSLEISYTYGDKMGSATVTQNINSLESVSVEIPNTEVIAEGVKIITMEITKVNGGADVLLIDNKLGMNLNGVKRGEHKKVLFEEGTGTWCQWCPRGAVFMDRMAERHEELFVGIAVHDGQVEPMKVEGYPEGIGYTSFPSMSTDRTGLYSFPTFSDVEDKYWAKISETPPAAVYSHAVLSDANDLKITAQADFLMDADQEYRLAVILVENGVTGTGSNYAQVNAYAGGDNGAMGGYESLPGTVPAADMVYDHVGRALISPFGGAPNSIPTDATAGASYDFNMPDFAVPEDFDVANLHIVTLLIDASGKVINANSQTLAEAADFVLGGNFVEANGNAAEVYPNPFTAQTNIFLSLVHSSDVNIKVFNTVGQLVLTQNYGRLTGNNNLPFNGAQLSTGAYMIQINLDDAVVTKRIMIQK